MFLVEKQDFFGKVVKINLQSMVNATKCQQSYMLEYMDSTGRIHKHGTDLVHPCVHILDLASMNPRARGFRRGFVGYPYGYLSAGTFDVLARLDLNDFGLETTRFIDLSNIDDTLGGFSGGFADGNWACFRFIYMSYIVILLSLRALSKLLLWFCIVLIGPSWELSEVCVASWQLMAIICVLTIFPECFVQTVLLGIRAMPRCRL